MSEQWWEHPEAAEYLRDRQEKLLPMIEEASVTLALYTGKADAKNAMEMGFMVLLDKPIILVIPPGTKCPRKLAMVADEIVEGDMDDPTVKARLMAAMERLGVETDGKEQE